jgi:predicted transposase YdaD
VKTDILFYRLFQEIPSIFFELIGNSPEEVSNYRFSSVEIKQTSFRTETILVYKFPNMSREEIEAMFGLSELKQTRFYQEAFQEGKEEGIEQGERSGKLKAVLPMLDAGLTVEQIAEALELSLEEVRQAVQQQSSDSSRSSEK